LLLVKRGITMERKFLDTLNVFKNTFKSIDWRFVSVNVKEDRKFCLHSVIRFSCQSVEKIKSLHNNLLANLGKNNFNDVSIHLTALPFDKWDIIKKAFLTGKIKINNDEFDLLQPIDFNKLSESTVTLDEYNTEWKGIDFFVDFHNNNLKVINNLLREFNTELFGYNSLEEMFKSWLHAEAPPHSSRLIFSIPIYAKIIDCTLNNKNTINVKVNAHSKLRGLILQVKTFKKYSVVNEIKEKPIKFKIKQPSDFIESSISVRMKSIPSSSKVRMRPDMYVQISLIHKEYGKIDGYYGKFSLSNLISKRYERKLPPFLATFHKFCPIKSYESSFKKSSKDEFEWAVATLFSLANIPTIWLRNHDQLIIDGQTIGGVDGIAYVEWFEQPTLLLIGCTLGVIKDDIETIVNVKEALRKHLRIANLNILPIIVLQKVPSKGIRSSAKKSGVAIIGLEELKSILQDVIRNKSVYEILDKIFRISKED